MKKKEKDHRDCSDGLFPFLGIQIIMRLCLICPRVIT